MPPHQPPPHQYHINTHDDDDDDGNYRIYGAVDEDMKKPAPGRQTHKLTESKVNWSEKKTLCDHSIIRHLMMYSALTFAELLCNGSQRQSQFIISPLSCRHISHDGHTTENIHSWKEQHSFRKEKNKWWMRYDDEWYRARSRLPLKVHTHYTQEANIYRVNDMDWRGFSQTTVASLNKYVCVFIYVYVFV